MARLERALAAVALVWLAACAAPAAPADIYRRGAAGDPATLDPHHTTTVIEGDVLLDLYEGLVTYDARGGLVPGAAERWEISADRAVYTFHLRADGRWSNGDPVTAQDFVFALRRLEAPDTAAAYATLLYTIKNAEAVNKGEADPTALGVEALDALTLRIVLERPAPYFLAQLAHQIAAPLHRPTVQAFGPRFTRPEHSVTNGPYRLAYFLPNDHITLVKNPYFHDAAHVAVARVEIAPIEDRAAALRRFMAGELDAYADAPVDQLGFARAALGDRLKMAPLLGVSYFAFNTARKPFDDVRVRRALAMVVDRDFLADKIQRGAMAPTYGLVPPGLAGYGAPERPDWAALGPADRMARAKALLAEAGYGPDRPLVAEIRFSTSETQRATAIALADMWRPLGLEATLVNSDAKTLFALMRDGAFDIARAGWIGDYSDPQNFLFLCQSDNRGLNYARYADAGFDGLMRASAQAGDVERMRDLHAAEALLMRDAPLLTLMNPQSKNMVQARVRGWEPNVMDRHPTRFISLAP